MSTPSSSDWRSQLQLHVRERVIGNIMETLKNNVKESDANNLKEMLRIAVQFEEATYAASSSMDDYFRNISIKLTYVETMNQPSAPTNSGSTTSSSRPSGQINPKISASAFNVSGLPKFGFMNQNLRHAGWLPASESTSTYASNSHNMSGMLQCSLNNAMGIQQSQNLLKYNQATNSQKLKQNLHHFSLSHLQMQQKQQSTRPLMSSNLHSNPSSPYPNLNPNHQSYFGSTMLFQGLPNQQDMSMQKNALQGQGLGLQSNLLEQEMQQRHPLLHIQSVMNRQPFDQKKNRNMGTTDWQEEGYQKLRSMKEQYFTELNQVQEKTKLKLKQLDSLVPSEKHAEQLRILNNLTVKLDIAIELLMLPKDKITVDILKKATVYEEHISKFLSQCKQRKIAQANQSQLFKLEASGTSLKHQNFLPCATNTSQSNVGLVQASSSLSQFDSTNELNYLRIKHRSSTGPTAYEYSAGQRQNYYNQLLKEATSCQNVPISLPQYCHNSSRKSEDGVMLSSPNSKLPTESASPPLIDNEEQKSAPPLLAESNSQDGNQGAAETFKTSVTKQPIDCLIESFQSLEPEYLRPAIGSIESHVAMNEMIPISRCGYGYKGNMIEDIAELANYCPPSKKMKRDITAIPQNVSTVGSANDEFKQKHDFISSEVKSTDTTLVKGIKYEIREINHKHIDLVLEVGEEDTDFDVATSEYISGNVVKCSYSTASLCSDLKARLCCSQMSSILPLRLWVPTEYPKCSPFPMMDLEIGPNMELGAIHSKARSRFERSARCLSEPISVKDMANTWGVCVREAISEYAKK